MIRHFKTAIVAALIVTAAYPAYAQVCKEKGGSNSGHVNLDCDMRYRDTEVTCDKMKGAGSDPNVIDTVGTNPSCPPKAMPMIDTPKRSYIGYYSPYLFTYPRDQFDPTRPYAGVYATGTPGDTSRTFQLFGNTAPGTKRLAACTTQLLFPSDAKGPEDDAKMVRMQLDNCVNQYILNSAIVPYQKEATQLLSLEDPNNPAAKIDLKSQCQPLKTFQEKDNEYNAADYIKAAWIKMLKDPDHRKTTKNIKNVPCTGLGGLIDVDIPCDREPHLPSGLKIENPLDPPENFPDELLLSSIASVPYEEIVDPTHPFSPRWDFLLSDRDYSNPGPAMLLNGTAVMIYAALGEYLSETDNAVFCAGVKKDDSESDKDKKKDKEVRVDVLTFREKPFEEALKRRTTYNVVCYNHSAQFTSGNDAWWMVILASYCNTITGFSWVYPWIYGKDFDCWKCFGLNGKVDDEDKHPPCTTHYLGKDLKMEANSEVDVVIGFFPGMLNLFKTKAQCNYPLQSRDDKYNMDKVCADLRAPYTQINKLKMRYHNPKDSDDSEKKNVVLKEGALEGLTFKEYFGNRMPYPRLWDTGSPLLKEPIKDKNTQPPTDVTGQYTAIVGVGREAAAKSASDGASSSDGQKPEEKYTDQRCKSMGWNNALGDLAGIGMSVSFGGVTVYPPDPVTSWTEMKLYQARTLRNVGMSCIARYEKVFKPGSAENMILMASGADWQKLIVSKCAKDKGGTTKDCEYMTLNEYQKDGSKTSDDSTIYMQQLESAAWPNSWRGYMASGGFPSLPTHATKFPNFGNGSTTMPVVGLDNAQLGDIILLPYGPGNSMSKPGLAKLAMVIETNLPSDAKSGETSCTDRKNCYVKVFEPDNGKWPDICGSTDTWGEMKTRYYFKPGNLPENAKETYENIKSISTCEETRISHCEQTAWSSLQIYRIRSDERKGCDKEKSSECTEEK